MSRTEANIQRQSATFWAAYGSWIGMWVTAVAAALLCRTDRQSAVAADQASAKTSRPKIVAIVNGVEVTRQQLAEECVRRYGSDVLQSVINKHLIWQACRQQGVQITDQDVDAEIKRLAGKFGLSPGRWLTLLREERDISPEQYRREVIWPSLALRALAAEQIRVSDEELRQAFETEYGPQVKARAITVASRQKADQLRAAAVAQPDEFGRLAKEHSEDQSASVQGLIPPIRKHLGDPNLERVAFSLEEGEVSEVIPIANQFVILKCEKHLPATYIAPRFRRDAENRIRDRVQDQKLRASAARLFKQLQDRAEVTNVFNDTSLRERMPGVAALVNQQKITLTQLAEECIERHGKEVLEGEINRTILTQELRRKGFSVTAQDIDAEIARAADAYGYLKPDGSPDVEAWLADVQKEDNASIELYVRDAVWPSVALKKIVDQKVTVTEKDVQKGFVANYGPRVEVLAIVLSSHRQAQRVWKMARDNSTDAFFGELAHQYSVDPVSRENFGRVPPIRKNGGRPELEKEAFSLKPGEVSAIIASEDKYVILRCTGYTTPVVDRLDDEVREELIKDLREKKLRLAMNIEFSRLLEAAQIDNFLAGTSQTGARRTSSRAATTAARPAAGPKRR